MNLKGKILKIVLVIFIIVAIWLATKYIIIFVAKTMLNASIKDKYGKDYEIVHYYSNSKSDLEKERKKNKGSYSVSSGSSGFYIASKKDKIIFQIWNYSEIPSFSLESYSSNIDKEKLEITKKIIKKLNNNTDYYYYIRHIALNTSTPVHKIDVPYYSFEFDCVKENEIKNGDIGTSYQKKIAGKIGMDFSNIELY